MADYDVLVIGGGPAGYTAALTAASRGATVALAEAEQPGGACVHFACIPTNALTAAVAGYLGARALDVVGIMQAGDELRLGQASDRAEAVVRAVAENVRAALAQRKVRVLHARATLAGATSITLSGDDPGELSAEAIVVATGTRWDSPAIPGLAAERLLTADQVLRLRLHPATALILADGAADAGFALEYATLLAAAGTSVTLVSARDRLLPGLDAAFADLLTSMLADLGIAVLTNAEIVQASERGSNLIEVRQEQGTTAVPAEVVISVDRRRPFLQGLGLERAGIAAGARIEVDRGCRTTVPSIFAAGDVTGGAMISAAALRMGEIAGVNATGGEMVMPASPIPRLLHTLSQIAWVGRTEEEARRDGFDVCTGVVDLGCNARALTLGAPLGMVKVVAERELGEVLGVHVVGPEAAEIIAVAAGMIQAELTLDDLAATVHWHPSLAESLTDAARRALKR